MAFYLGIDGGGTKTRCALGNETEVIATSIAGPCNVVRVGSVAAREALHSAVHAVCARAKISAKKIRSISIGAAGAAREDIGNQIRKIFHELTPAAVEVVPDTVIALEAAFGSGPGVIAISGTGSIIFGRNARGETARAGGWGYAISDEGSAQWIGRRAVWSILRALDQGERTKLSGHVLKAWNLKTLDELVVTANAVPPPEFPMLFPIVSRAAKQGDPMAVSILREAGVQLAEQAGIVIRRLFPDAEPSPQLEQRRLGKTRVQMQVVAAQTRLKRALVTHARVAMTGSVFRQSEQVREVFYNRLQANLPNVEIRQDMVEPVEGALARARRSL
jgi:N-acetylglucosamine kinase-like BadF-type ATPase